MPVTDRTGPLKGDTVELVPEPESSDHPAGAVSQLAAGMNAVGTPARNCGAWSARSPSVVFTRSVALVLPRRRVIPARGVNDRGPLPREEDDRTSTPGQPRSSERACCRGSEAGALAAIGSCTTEVGYGGVRGYRTVAVLESQTTGDGAVDCE